MPEERADGTTRFTADESVKAMVGGLAGLIMRERDRMFPPIESVELDQDSAGDWQSWMRIKTKSGHTMLVSVTCIESEDP